MIGDRGQVSVSRAQVHFKLSVNDVGGSSRVHYNALSYHMDYAFLAPDNTG